MPTKKKKAKAVKRIDTFIEEVRRQIGVRFIPQARQAGKALDCAGIVVVPAEMAGYPMADNLEYNLQHQDYSEMLLGLCGENGDEVSMAGARPGDVVLFWISSPNKPRHIGVLTDDPKGQTKFRFVHTAYKVGRAVEDSLDEHWESRIHSVWRLREPSTEAG